MALGRVPRLKDVAKAANVSLAAASRILRGDREQFGEETCQRVLETSRQLGWRRNLLVNGMQTGRTQTIGVMIPPNDSYWVEVVSGIHDALAVCDYLPITVWTGSLSDIPHFHNDEGEGLKQINRLLDRRVDGLIMWPPFSAEYYHHFPEFVERRVPVVVIDHHSTVADSVETDEEQATSVIATHLLNLGHRWIACLSSCETASQTWAVKRRSSFEDAVRKCPDATVKSWHLNAQWSDGLEVARQLLTDELRPTAVFAVTDRVATFVNQAAAELEMRVPRDLSIVGFADLDFAATMNPPLTTMRHRAHEIGRFAVKLIMDRIDGVIPNDDAPTTIKVAADPVIRNSTTKPRPEAREMIGSAKGPQFGDAGERSNELQQRIGHILEAVEHLHAAGMYDAAANLTCQAGQMAEMAGVTRQSHEAERDGGSQPAR
ncbi:MAG: LacI family transcriptional regulator [Planctomycetes bacterium]|nr:LacI family transcriptional regulator [Planctomycetota bacterium]